VAQGWQNFISPRLLSPLSSLFLRGVRAEILASLPVSWRYIEEKRSRESHLAMMEDDDVGNSSKYEINELCKPKFTECSQLPFMAPIFSCGPCDEWRNRVHSVQYKRRGSADRSSMSKKFQCHRIAKGYGPIRVRVVLKSTNLSCHERETEASDQRTSEVLNTQTCIQERRTRKGRRAEAVVARLKQAKKVSELQVQHFELQEKCADLEQQLDNSKKRVRSLQTMLSRNKAQQSLMVKNKVGTDAVGSDGDLLKLCRYLDKFFAVHYSGKHAKSKAKLLLDALNSGLLFHGEGVAIIADLNRLYVKNVFKDWKVLKCFDCSPIGAFKTSTVKALNAVLDDGKIGLFPSPSAVDRARQMLDKYAVEKIGFRREMTKYGEVYYLNFDRVIRLLLEATGLYEKAQRESVCISFTADGALLLNSRTHVSCGVKITDVDGIHPVTKAPLTAIDEDTDEQFYNCMQSRELCAIMVMADAKDSKELYEDVFKDFYEYAEKLRIEGMPECDGQPALKPFKVAHPQDMKSTQTVCKRGGNCKMKTYFCHLCSCTKHKLLSYKTGEERCDRCKRRGKDKCYHTPVCDSTRMEMLLQDLESSVGEYYEKYKNDFHNVQKQTKLRCDPTQADREVDINHIDFVIPEDDLRKKREFSQFIAKECLLRKISIRGTGVDEWRELLRLCIKLETKIQFLLTVRQWYDEGIEKVPLVAFVELLVPCILHLENRVGEKIINMIIRYGFQKRQQSPAQFIEQLQQVFRTEVLGSVGCPSQWKIPFTRESDGSVKIDPIQERNTMIRGMVNNVEKIVEGAIPENELEFKERLKLACSKYSEAMKILTTHRALTEDEMEEFQDLVDDFFEIWVELFGMDGMTNYLHLLGSGHVLYFLRKYNCLYIYSQQGWEALNSVCTAYILQNSSRGGYGSGQNKTKSYIFPLIRYIMRDLLWKTNMADNFFLDQEHLT